MQKLCYIFLLLFCNSTYSMQPAKKNNIDLESAMQNTMVDFDEIGVWVALRNNHFDKLNGETMLGACLGRFSPMPLSVFMSTVSNSIDEYWSKNRHFHEMSSKQEVQNAVILSILLHKPDTIELLKQAGHISQ